MGESIKTINKSLFINSKIIICATKQTEDLLEWQSIIFNFFNIITI